MLILAALVVSTLWYAGVQRSAADGAHVLTIHDDALRGRVWDIERALARGTAVDEPERGTGRTPLMYAALGGRAEAALLLLGRGARLEASSDVYGTALAHAAGAGEADMVRLLLARGADPNSRAAVIGMTPLLLATMSERAGAAADELIAHGACVNDANRKGTTPLMHAASNGDDRLVRRLLAAHAHAGARDCAGRDAAEIAACAGHPRTAALIRRRRA